MAALSAGTSTVAPWCKPDSPLWAVGLAELEAADTELLLSSAARNSALQVRVGLRWSGSEGAHRKRDHIFHQPCQKWFLSPCDNSLKYSYSYTLERYTNQVICVSATNDLCTEVIREAARILSALLGSWMQLLRWQEPWQPTLFSLGQERATLWLKKGWDPGGQPQVPALPLSDHSEEHLV